MSRSYYRTRIKFCGMTRAGDVRLAGELGVDAVGFIFARESSRRVAPAEARAMRQAIAPMVDVVALFRNNSKEEVASLFTSVFSSSEGEHEGKLIGRLALALAARTDNQETICMGAYADGALIGAIFFTRLRFAEPVEAY